MCQHIGPASGTDRVDHDLGGGPGALIIYTGQDRCGQEIGISPVDQTPDGPRTHSEVREWRVTDAVFFSAVYPELRAGIYQIWWDSATPVGRVTVRNGSVVQFSWPTRPGGG